MLKKTILETVAEAFVLTHKDAAQNTALDADRWNQVIAFTSNRKLLVITWADLLSELGLASELQHLVCQEHQHLSSFTFLSFSIEPITWKNIKFTKQLGQSQGKMMTPSHRLTSEIHFCLFTLNAFKILLTIHYYKQITIPTALCLYQNLNPL